MALEIDFLVFIVALGLAAFTPGPGIAAIVAIVLKGGAKWVLWFSGGVIVGDLIWLALSLSGLAFIAQQIPIVFVVIKWAGVSYLLYLAIKIWKAIPETDQSVEEPKQESILGQVFAGLSITMGNPKAMLFYLAVLPSIVSSDQITIAMALSLSMTVIAILVIVFSVYIMAANKARLAMSNGQSVRKLNRISSIAIGGAAVWIASR